MAEMKMPGLQYVSGAALPGAEESLEKYKQATQKVSEALERRINEPSINWFEIAGAALAPTRSGNFFESLGNVNTVMGQQQRRAEERELPIAQMRALLAGQQYQTEQDARAQKMLASALGGADLQSVAQMLATPEGAISNPAIMGRLFALQGALPPDSKYGTQVKNLIDTQAKMIDIGIKSGQLNLDQLKAYNQGLETQFKTGVPPAMPNIIRPSGVQPTSGQSAEGQTAPAVDFTTLGNGDWRITSGTGPRTLRGAPNDHGMGLDVGGVKAGTIANAPVTGTVVDVGSNKGLGNYLRIKTPDGKIVTAAHWQNVNVKAGDEVIAGQTPIGAVGSTGNTTGPHIHFEAKGADGKPIDPRTLFASGQSSQTNQSTTRLPDTEPGVFVTADGYKIYRGNMIPESWEKAKVDAQKNAVDRMSSYTTERNKEMAKSDVKQIDALRDSASASATLRQLALNQISLVKASPTAFGYLNDPSASSAFFRAIKTAQNTGMVFNPDEVARYVKGVTNVDDLNTLALFANNAMKINLQIAKEDFKGQGAVTENERAMIALLGGITSDSPEVIRLKADALLKNSERNMEVRDAFVAFEAKNPNATYNQFLRSSELKEIKQKYDDIFEQMRKDTEKILNPKSRAKTQTQEGVPNYVDQLNAVTGQ